MERYKITIIKVGWTRKEYIIGDETIYDTEEKEVIKKKEGISPYNQILEMNPDVLAVIKG